MRHNYWAGTNAEMLAEGYPSDISKIWDVEDDISLGRIDYRGVENLAIDVNVTLESRFIWPFEGGTGEKSADYAGRDRLRRGRRPVGGTLHRRRLDLVSGHRREAVDLPVHPAVRRPAELPLPCDRQSQQRRDNTGFDHGPFRIPSLTTEGVMTADETWTGPGPIVLTGDVVIPAGTTLTIDPGTEIRVEPFLDNSHGGLDSTLTELIVEGTLIAQGTGPGSILMSPDSMTPVKGSWYGIY